MYAEQIGRVSWHADSNRRSTMVRSILAVAAGYCTFAAGMAALFFVLGVDRLMPPTPAFVAGVTLYGMAFAALGGLVATLMAGDRTDRHARLVAVLIGGLALISVVTQYGRESVWLDLATLLLMTPATRMGAALGRRPQADRSTSG